MMQDSNYRRLQAIKSKVAPAKKSGYAPSIKEGRDGDEIWSYIVGKGFYHFKKYNNRWFSRLYKDEPLSLEDEISSSVRNIEYHTSTVTTLTVNMLTVTGSTSGIDHGELDGLGNDDHLQYHNDARGDARYYTEAELDAGQLDNRYYTGAKLDAGQLDNRYYTRAELDAGQLDNRYYTEAELDATTA